MPVPYSLKIHSNYNQFKLISYPALNNRLHLTWWLTLWCRTCDPNLSSLPIAPSTRPTLAQGPWLPAQVLRATICTVASSAPKCSHRRQTTSSQVSKAVRAKHPTCTGITYRSWEVVMASASSTKCKRSVQKKTRCCRLLVAAWCRGLVQASSAWCSLTSSNNRTLWMTKKQIKSENEWRRHFSLSSILKIFTNTANLSPEFSTRMKYPSLSISLNHFL